MILSLLGVGFLLFANASKCTSVNVVDSNNIVDSDPQLRLTKPFNANYFSNVIGVYNFKDRFDFSSYWFESEDSEVLRFESIDRESNNYIVPFSYDSKLYYIESLSFRTDYYNADDKLDIKLTVYYYDFNDSHYNTEMIIYDDSSLSDYTSNDLYNCFFNVCNSTPLSDYENDYFFALFTSEDNQYLTSYSGYYSFLTSNNEFNRSFNVLGNLVFDNKAFYGFSNLSTSQVASYYTIWFNSFDSINSVYSRTNYSFPFNNSKVVSQNMLISYGKMTISTKQYLTNIGVFAYQRDTSYDDTEMHDLILSIADSPIYMLSRLLNFELFGMNVFVAFSGLLTLAIVIVVIRKIW